MFNKICITKIEMNQFYIVMYTFFKKSYILCFYNIAIMKMAKFHIIFRQIYIQRENTSVLILYFYVFIIIHNNL